MKFIIKWLLSGVIGFYMTTSAVKYVEPNKQISYENFTLLVAMGPFILGLGTLGWCAIAGAKIQGAIFREFNK